MSEYITPDAIKCFFKAINDSGINYVLIKNIGNELPNQLIIGKDIDLLVKEADMVKYLTFMNQAEFTEIVHPQSSKTNWKFAYGTHECYMHENKSFVMVDAHCELCVKSLCDQMWIPLDAEINKRVWENAVWDEMNQWRMLDDITLLVYLISRCVFDKRLFSDAYIHQIQKLKPLIGKAKPYLEKIFFKFTKPLIELIIAERFGDIVSSHLKFANY